MLTQGRVCPQLALQHSAVADNYAQKIVEVMGDPSRKTPNCFHLLRHAQLSFEDSLFGDILGESVKIGDSAVFIVDATAGTVHGDRRAVLPLPLHFDVLDFFRTDELLDQTLIFSRVAEDFAGQVFAEKLFGRLIAEHSLQGWIYLQKP